LLLENLDLLWELARESRALWEWYHWYVLLVAKTLASMLELILEGFRTMFF